MKKAYGFTIVELLTVVVIIAVLATISIVAYDGVRTKANESTVMADMNAIGKKMEEYRTLSEGGAYPYNSTMFRSSGVKFSSSSSYGFVICCFNAGSPSTYTLDWGTGSGSAGICAQASGGELTGGVWLHGPESGWTAGWVD